MSLKNQKFYLIYILWLLIFLFTTNQHLNFKEIISINQIDSASYMSIAISAPEFSQENIPYHHAQRVFIPYITGLLSNTFDFEIFYVFKILTILIIFLIIYCHYWITIKIKSDFYLSVLSISFLILNPYLLRYFIAVPTMINDVVFILSLYLFSIGLIFKKKITLLGFFLGILSRQNGIFLFIAYLINNFLHKNFKIIKDKKTILALFIMIIVSMFANKYAEEVSIDKFNYMHVYGIFEWIYNSFNLAILLKWFMLPLYSYLPIIIFISIFLRLNFIQKININNFLIIIFIFVSIIGVSYLSGPGTSGRNIIRLTTLVYPLILISILCFMKLKNKIFSIPIFYFILFILHIWSFHPKYSIFSITEVFRNYLI